MNKNEILNNLLDHLLTLPKFETMENEKKELLKTKLINEYNDRINKLIIINIPLNKSEEFLAILDSKNTSRIDKYIEEQIPNLDDLIEAETSRFIQQIILKGQ